MKKGTKKRRREEGKRREKKKKRRRKKKKQTNMRTQESERDDRESENVQTEQLVLT